MLFLTPETGRLGASHGTTRRLHSIGMFIGDLRISSASEKARARWNSPLPSPASFSVCRCALPTLGRNAAPISLWRNALKLSIPESGPSQALLERCFDLVEVLLDEIDVAGMLDGLRHFQRLVQVLQHLFLLLFRDRFVGLHFFDLIRDCT